MRKKIKKYYVNPEDSAVLAMSVVDEPAVESDFVYLSKQKIEKFIGLETNEKHMIYGCALRPDFPIYRRDENEEYYLEFSKEAVEKLARNFMVNGLQQNFTEAHKSEVEGITITESWIKADMEKDKSVAIGLDKDLPLGTWFIGAYCNNAEVWDNVKSGTYNGFSVEAIVNVDELKFESQEPSVEDNIKELEAELEEQIASEPNQEPVVDNIDVVDEPTVEEPREKGILAKILELINGKPIEDVSKAEEPVVEEPKVEEELEPTVEPEPQTEPEPQVEPQPNPLEEVVKNLQEEIKALKDNNSSLLEQIREMGKKPSVEPTNLNPKGNGNVETGVKNSAYQAWREQVAKAIG